MKNYPNDNHHVKRILDIEQNEWTKIEEKKKAIAHSGQRASQNTTLGVDAPAQRAAAKRQPRRQPREQPAQYKNPFSVLPDHANYSDPKEVQVEERKTSHIRHRSSNQNFAKSKKSRSSSPNNPNHHEQETSSKPNHKLVLVIGDSMVKKIDQRKIGRAARSNAVCHSYSGATV